MSANKSLIIICLFLFACSGSGVKPQPKPKPSPKPQVTGTIELTKEWNTFVGLGASHRDFRYQMVNDDNLIYVVARQGRIYAIDKISGDRIWVHDLNTPVSAGISLSNGKLLLGTTEGQVMAVDIKTKEISWSTSLQSELLHAPVTDGAKVVCQLNDGSIYTLDINTGDILWSVVTNNPALTQRGSSSPLLVDNIVVAGFATGRLLIINALNGTRLWQSEIGRPSGNNEIGRLVDIDATMYMDQAIVYSTATHGNLAALSLSSGIPKTIWKKEFSGGSGIVGTTNRIYATDSNGRIASFNKKTGERYWLNDNMSNYFYNSPVIWQKHLVVADQLGYINLIDLQTGDLAGLYRNSPYAVQSEFLTSEDQLYVLDIGGFLSAVSIDK